MRSGPGKLVVPMFVLGLLSGGALGSWGQREMMRRRMRDGDVPDVQRMLDHLDRDLHLDPQQKEAVKKILLVKQTEMAAQEKEHRDKAEALRQAVRRELAGTLTPEQQTKFKTMCERADKRIKQRWPEKD